MNKPIRKVSIAIAVLFLALFVNLNVVQVLQGSSYRNNTDNRRVLLNEYSNPRGQITVGGDAVAESVATDDQLKYLRKYPDGPVYAPATGYYSIVYGKEGIEDSTNSILTGNDPDLFGTKLADLLTGRDPKGGSVQLTLNARAQKAAYEAMGNRRGAVVALDPKTGAILAMVSTPSYDPNKLSGHDTGAIQRAWEAYNKSTKDPLLNRTTKQVYPAGSMFKVIDTAAALADDSKLTASTRLAAPNSYWPLDTERKSACPANGEAACVENFDGEVCDNGKTATLALALAKSCNTTFSKLVAEDLGGTKLAQMAQKFGLDAPYSGDDPGDLCRPAVFEVPLPVCHSTPGSESDLRSPDTLAQTAIGQRDVGVTPLQAAMLSAAVANNGTLMKPYLINKELRPDLSVLREADPEQLSQVLTPERDAELVQMMEGVVESSQGTGGPARIPELQEVKVGGKTGTADHGVRGKDGKFPPPHAWFTGFALAKGDPKIAVSVIIEDGGVSGNETTGGLAAAPVAKKVMLAYLRSIGVK
ncbi:cell elongation-specific peptidoglycan D,D-transpeptidase [Jatrophihabitans endophyticus]|uniref:Cell elongation-specific peptidoglycan D,D-transpeptidase n=1 Tax=Jatrophihabitans endophyticus TaxID=1206085 RepID=A0A1M5I7N6_9ACTN|nr:penicillin-binding protein 2 [Jatrophihabitans endophyticus]SHG24109.1 cell elongation-specific peptidoglycan D,D-transpeptidase [Jatrophihabitans endophyticus]